MHTRDFLRVLALVVVVVATVALVVGACTRPAANSARSETTTPARRADPKPTPPPPGTGGESADGSVQDETKTKNGERTKPDPQKPGPSRVDPKGRKGMLGHMHLQGGD